MHSRGKVRNGDTCELLFLHSFNTGSVDNAYIIDGGGERGTSKTQVYLETKLYLHLNAYYK